MKDGWAVQNFGVTHLRSSVAFVGGCASWRRDSLRPSGIINDIMIMI